jgi:hypothetical protein
VKGLLIGVVGGVQDVKHAHPVRAFGCGLLESVCEQLLTHELVERLVEQQLEGQQVTVDGSFRVEDGLLVPAPPLGIALRVWVAQPIGLGVLPLHQHELDDSVRSPVQECSVDAGTPGPACAEPARRFAEDVRRPDVLEGQEPAGLDLQDLGDVEDLAERPLHARGVGDHLSERVDALHLRRQQMVARPALDARMPRDTQFLEQGEGLYTDLWQQRQPRVLDR